MNTDGSIRTCGVTDGGPLRHARPDAIVCGPCHNYLGALGFKVGSEVLGDIEVELRFGVAAIGFRPSRITRFRCPPVPDWTVNERWVPEVATVMSRVDRDNLSR
jgi:hypothetical protein